MIAGLIALCIALYVLGGFSMMCLTDLELRTIPRTIPGRGVAIAVASIVWPFVILYALVGVCFDGIAYVLGQKKP